MGVFTHRSAHLTGDWRLAMVQLGLLLLAMFFVPLAIAMTMKAWRQGEMVGFLNKLRLIDYQLQTAQSDEERARLQKAKLRELERMRSEDKQKCGRPRRRG